MRVVGQRLQVGGGFQQGRGPCGAGQGFGAGLPLAQRRHERACELSGCGADQARQCQSGGDFTDTGLELLGQHFGEAARESGAPDVLVQRFAGVDGLPVVAQGHVEGGQRAAEGSGEREADRQDDPLEVRAGRRGAGQVDPDGQERLGPGGCAPLVGAVLGAGQRGFDLAEEGGLAYAADTVKDDHIGAGRFEVFHVKAGGAGAAQVLLERGGDQGPLVLPIGERLRGVERRVVGAEQRTQVGHGPPTSDRLNSSIYAAR